MHIYRPLVSVLLFIVLSSGITLAQTEPKSLGEIARELREKKQAQPSMGVSAPLSVKDGNLLGAWPSRVRPGSSEITGAIEKAL